MNFITQVTISIVLYFIMRISVKRSSSLYISSLVASLSYILMYLFLYQSITLLPTIHFLVTGLSLIILFISYYEIVLLERNVRKIKLGLFQNAESFPTCRKRESNRLDSAFLLALSCLSQKVFALAHFTKQNICFKKKLKINAPNSCFQNEPNFFYIILDFFNKFLKT